jgi:hypothetical protein
VNLYMIDSASIATIITAIATIVSVVLGANYNKGKNVAVTKMTQISNLLSDIVEAAKDDKVTEAEFQKIVDDAKACVSKIEET